MHTQSRDEQSQVSTAIRNKLEQRTGALGASLSSDITRPSGAEQVRAVIRNFPRSLKFPDFFRVFSVCEISQVSSSSPA